MTTPFPPSRKSPLPRSVCSLSPIMHGIILTAINSPPRGGTHQRRHQHRVRHRHRHRDDCRNRARRSLHRDPSVPPPFPPFPPVTLLSDTNAAAWLFAQQATTPPPRHCTPPSLLRKKTDADSSNSSYPPDQTVCAAETTVTQTNRGPAQTVYDVATVTRLTAATVWVG